MKPTTPGLYVRRFATCPHCSGTSVRAVAGQVVACRLCEGGLQTSGWTRLEDSPEYLTLQHSLANTNQVVEWLMARVEALEGKTAGLTPTGSTHDAASIGRLLGRMAEGAIPTVEDAGAGRGEGGG